MIDFVWWSMKKLWYWESDNSSMIITRVMFGVPLFEVIINIALGAKEPDTLWFPMTIALWSAVFLFAMTMVVFELYIKDQSKGEKRKSKHNSKQMLSFDELFDLEKEAQEDREEQLAEYNAERLANANQSLHEAQINSKRGK